MEQYLEQKQKLVDLQKNTDFEAAHYEADQILLEVLLALGLNDIVEEYEKINKWYAWHATIYAGIAQLVEHTTDNREVTGSSPVIRTNIRV